MARIRPLSRATALAVALTLAVPGGPARASTVRVRGMDVRAEVASLLPERGALLGAWVKPRRWTMAAQKRAIRDFERMIRRKLDISHHYYDFRDVFPTWRERWDLQSGRVPMIDWDGVDTRAVANGSEDHRIRERARGVAALGRPVLLRFFWEMDVQDDKVASPNSFVDAWRRAYQLFQDEGASNAAWVWCPTAWGFVSGDAQRYYPGNAYVDWVCADGYNWAPRRPGAKWRTFREIFTAFYRWGRGTGKPLMVGETGAQEGRRGKKARWITGARRALKQRFPDIASLVYFHSDTIYPWWVDTSRSAKRAFRRLARDPYFN